MQAIIFTVITAGIYDGLVNEHVTHEWRAAILTMIGLVGAMVATNNRPQQRLYKSVYPTFFNDQKAVLAQKRADLAEADEAGQPINGSPTPSCRSSDSVE